MSSERKKEWYQRPKEEVVEEWGSDIHSGLSEYKAQERLKKHGKNLISKEEKVQLIDRIVDELKSPLVFILLLAGIATTILGHYVDATIIFIALIINILISLYQEGRANKAFELLRASQEKYAIVVRDGKHRRISSEDLVVGDIVIIETGVNIPADMRLLVVNNLEVNESPLTGEWIDVQKNEGVFDRLLPLSEQSNMVFMGTLVTCGSAVGVVVATGNATAIGAIAQELAKSAEPKTPIQENIAQIARFLSYIVLATLVVIFVLGLFRGESVSELLLVSIAIAVAAIPEGLPAAITVVLAIGMEAILKRGGLVRNLLAAETLGSTTVILTDKTGTLTKAQMQVARVVTLGSILAEKNKKDERLSHEAHGDERDVLQFATLASNAFIEKTGNNENDALAGHVIHGRPVEQAIVSAALETGLDQTDLLKKYSRVDFLPFESRYRAAFSLHHIYGVKEHRLYVSGAPEYILEKAQHVYLEGRVHNKTLEIESDFNHQLKNYTSKGMRLIGVGFRDVPMHKFPRENENMRDDLTEKIVLAGFIVLHDPLRDDVKESIHLAQKAGARVVMATGDNAETARTIASECGIWREGDHVLSGADVEKSNDEELMKKLRSTTVFARMLPEHKLRLINLLVESGETVAMTGDGVNDAPALRAASIGVALGSGTEVAKESSDLILLNNSFSIIVSAIEEGRRIVDNLRKIVAYLLSTSFTEIFIVGGALLLNFPLPLLPAQILWTNILTEGFMNFAFAFEPKEGNLMNRDPKISGAKQMLSKKYTAFIVSIGVCAGIVFLLIYWYLVSIANLPIAEARTLVFIMITLGTSLIAFSLKDLHIPLYRIPVWSNIYLLGSTFFVFVGLYVAIFIAPLSSMLGVVEIKFAHQFVAIAGVTVVNIIIVEIAKYFTFERRHGA